jgi:septation ring formation regulator EzrA
MTVHALATSVNPFPVDRVWKNRRNQVVKGILNPHKATEQAVLIENLVQEGHKFKKQNVLVTSTIEEDVSSAL